jgi:hypothetical protein
MIALQVTTLHARPIYLAAMAGSLLVSVWVSQVQFIPNSDAALYLRAAELFSAGQWREGAAVYHWPFYSLLVAAVTYSTGLAALAAAHVVNALLYVLITVAFIALVGRLAAGDRIVLVCAASIVLLHPRLLQLRSSIIRDHGYYAFLLLSLYWIVRDQQEPRVWSKLYALGAVLLATAFRIEALFVAALVPGYYVFTHAKSRTGRLLVFGGTALIGLLLLPGFLLWATIQQWIFATADFDPVAVVTAFFDSVRGRVRHLGPVLAPWGRGFEWVSYVSLTVGITVYETLRAFTWPLALLAAFAFVPRRLVPDQATRLVLWFAGWQIPLLLLFTFFNAFTTWRYSMTIVLLMTIPIVFVLAHAVRGLLSSAVPLRRWPSVAAILLIVGTAVVYFPKPTRLGYLVEAAQWIKANLPPSAVIMTNDGRIAYFSGRAYGSQIVIAGAPHAPSERQLRKADFAVISIDRAGVPGYLADRPGVEFLATVSEGRGRQKVVAYRIR